MIDRLFRRFCQRGMIGNAEIIVRGKINHCATGDEQNWTLFIFHALQFSIKTGVAQRFQLRMNADGSHCSN